MYSTLSVSLLSRRQVYKINSPILPSLESQHICHDMNAHNNTDEVVWSFNIASPTGNSCSSKSVSFTSTKFKELMTHEAVTVNEMFGEVNLPEKRRKKCNAI